MRKWLESRRSRSSNLTDQLTESNTKIVRLVLIKKKGKLQLLILWDGLRVGNILEAFGQSFRTVAEVNRIGRLLAFFGCWCGGQIVQVKCSNGAKKRPIRCDWLGQGRRQVWRGCQRWRQQYSSRHWRYQFTCSLGLFAPFPSWRFKQLFLRLEVDRIGRLLGFGRHLDFKHWCGGQVVQLKCSNGSTKCPIWCDWLGQSCRQVRHGGRHQWRRYSSMRWRFRFTCLLGLSAPFPSRRFRQLLLRLTVSQCFFFPYFDIMINANPQWLISRQRYDWFRWNNDFVVTWCR